MRTFTHSDKAEVEKRVAQELKNDKDFKHNIGQCLQQLAKDIATISENQEKGYALAYGKRDALLVDVENLRDSIVRSVNEAYQRLGDVETKLLKALDAFSDLAEELSVTYATKAAIEPLMANQAAKTEELSKQFTDTKEYFNIALSALKAEFKADLVAAKKELTPKVPDVDPIKKELDDRFNVFKGDLYGLVKEIAILKKSSAYDQKKFENIYTLIQRLKEGKA